ncbi:zinc transporter ZntB [Shewanella algae]|uniref:zinc transporter ZntB n=1 Tax=Shewanella algae TaxID=38313 RepID=UPI000B8AF5CB|nr:zinc transporter ZntB [Shewanella algae]MBO2585634.1 zinc transporter ZntB [Shewanella algae]OXS01962.1 magnesium transporter CorA [Shewanella algae]
MAEKQFCALLLSGEMAGKELTQQQVSDWRPEQGILWLHLDYKKKSNRQWLQQHSGLEALEVAALLAQDTRPRVVQSGQGFLLALRGVNHNPGADPEDMVSIRLYLDNHRIISTSSRELLSVKDIIQSVGQGSGPGNTGEFLLALTQRLTQRKTEFIDRLEETVDDLEDKVMAGKDRDLRSDIAELRRQIVVVRRYLAPQREAFTRLLADSAKVFDEQQRLKFNEINDQLIRCIEDLDAIRDRASVTQEELQNRQAEAVNRRLYFLSLISAVFLPLGFLTGLLGVNIAGIPGADVGWAFGAFCLFLLLLVGGQLWLFYRYKWL